VSALISRAPSLVKHVPRLHLSSIRGAGNRLAAEPNAKPDLTYTCPSAPTPSIACALPILHRNFCWHFDILAWKLDSVDVAYERAGEVDWILSLEAL
jgi:hypothetical protein